MPLKESNDFGARDFDGKGGRKIHNHLFVGANTGLPELLKYPGKDEVIKAHADFLKGTNPDGTDRVLRVDLFGLKAGGTIDGPLSAPLRAGPLPKLQPGKTYLVEVVIRTLTMGHHLITWGQEVKDGLARAANYTERTIEEELERRKNLSNDPRRALFASEGERERERMRPSA